MSEKKGKGQSPAFNFYSSDFITGTQFMNYEQLGKYIRLLCAQHQHGHLSYEDMIIICSSYDDRVFSKFVQDEHGLYYNRRLEKEILKKTEYCKSRGKNRKEGLEKKKALKQNIGESGSYDDHMEIEIENIYSNKALDYVDKLENGVEKKIEHPFQQETLYTAFPLESGVSVSPSWFKPTPDDIPRMKLPEIKAGSAVQMVRLVAQKDITMEEAFQLWEVFKIQNFTGEKGYHGEPGIHSHFLNWCATKKYNDGSTNRSINSGGPVSVAGGTGPAGGSPFTLREGGFGIIRDKLRDSVESRASSGAGRSPRPAIKI